MTRPASTLVLSLAFACSAPGAGPHDGSESSTSTTGDPATTTGSAGTSGERPDDTTSGTTEEPGSSSGGESSGDESSTGTTIECDESEDETIDIDENGVADCAETLLTNGAFDSQIDPWALVAGGSVEWSDFDMLSAEGSGSALIGQSVEGAGPNLSQCVPIPGGGTYSGYVLAVNPSGGGGILGVLGSVTLSFHAAPDCTDEIQTAIPPPTTITTEVTRLSATAPAPGNAVAVKIGLNALAMEPVDIYFDNALLRLDPT